MDYQRVGTQIPSTCIEYQRVGPHLCNFSSTGSKSLKGRVLEIVIKCQRASKLEAFTIISEDWRNEWLELSLIVYNSL